MNDALLMKTPVQYRYCWHDRHYRRVCEIIAHVGQNRSRVRFLDNGEVTIIKQMALRMIKPTDTT